MIGIYKITSPSGRIYIGQSIDIEKRFRDYLNVRNVKTQPKLYRSFKKYGVENHIFEIITECDIDELNELERYYQELFNCIDKGLNCILTSAEGKKQVFSKETLLKKSEAVKGDKHPHYGKKLSEITRLRISEGNKGKTISEEHRLKISNTSKGRKMPEGCIKSGLDNHKAVAIKSINIVTNESFILNISDTLKYFNCDRELVINRAKGISGVKSFRKHKDWIFEII